ncbi:MAG: hypothetical protein ACP5R4_01280 [Armatimonadota bacterium]
MKYVKAAFLHPLNIAALLGVGAASIFGTHASLGAASMVLKHAPLLFLLEVPYLVYVPRMRWFRARVDAAQRRERGLSEDIESLVAQITGFDRQRYLRLRHIRDSIHQSVPPENSRIVSDELAKLDRLLYSFLRMLVNANRYRKHLERLEEDEIDAKLERARRAVQSAADPELRSMHEKNLEILEKRRAEIGRFRRSVDRMETQLEMIENTFSYVADKFVAMCPPEEISSDLDALISNVESTEAVVAELAPVLDYLPRQPEAGR